MCLIAAFDLSTLWWWVDVIFKVGVSVGLVIFVHELGHYLVARACGVKIEKFMIGFDIGGYKLSWRRGETLYGIGILPLGGYVKMLGQDDDPAHIAEQMKKSQVDGKSIDAVPIIGPNGETYNIDRRSYLAKSVPQRMAIISAGVIMNIIFAFIFAVIAYGLGVSYVPAVVTEIMPGSPAWEAGLEPGDEIVKVNDQPDPTFIQLKGGVTLGNWEEGIPVVVRRGADGQDISTILKPEQQGGRLATIGIGLPQSLKLMNGLPVVDDSSAARAKLLAPAGAKVEEKFLGGDEILRVGDVEVKSFRELAAELARQPEKPLLITVRRQTKGDDEVAKAEPQSLELTFEVPPQSRYDLGLMLKMGPITSIRVNTPAAASALKVGDVIERVDGKRLGEIAEGAESWNAETLPAYLRRAAEAGREVEIVAIRPKGEQPSEEVTVRLKPVVPSMFNSPFPARSPGTPIASNEIGVAYRIENELLAVSPGSPAAEAKLAAGDVINRAKVILPKDAKGITPPPVIVDFVEKPGKVAVLLHNIFGGENAAQRTLQNWPTLLDLVQFAAPGTEVELTVTSQNDSNSRTAKLKPMPVADTNIVARGFVLAPIERIRKADSFAQQVQFGWDETTEALTMVFRFLRKLGTQVPISALGGPVLIAQAAGYSAAEGLSSLLIFLTMFSANLAVINFLPIPLLDGGHMVFLAYEGLRGRPANEKFVVALHTVGFVFIISLMLYVLALDLNVIPRNL